jgi:ATP-dependent RNA helicase DBP3
MAKRARPIDEVSNSVPARKKKKDVRQHEESTAENSDPVNGNKESKHRYVESQELTDLPQSTIDEFFDSNDVQVTGTLSLRPILDFSHLPPVHNGLYDPLKSYSKPTPIQSISWPPLFSGRDVIGVAETGSGKTMAFGLPCIQRALELQKSRSSPRIHGAIITPTRELALQIHDQLVKFTPATGISVCCVYGGVSKDEQRQALKKASIVVATPGRLNDLLREESVSLSKVRFLVLDEADRMLDKGFEQDIREIVAAAAPKKKRQLVMFTATWPTAIRSLAESFTTDPVTISIGGGLSNDLRANARITQTVEVVKPYDKEARLIALLRQHNGGNKDKILIFCLYKKEATRIERFIRSKGFKVAGIHGDMNQTERFKSLNAFKSGEVALLVATDVAARGLDIPAVKLVLNVTFPLTVEDVSFWSLPDRFVSLHALTKSTGF